MTFWKSVLKSSTTLFCVHTFSQNLITPLFSAPTGSVCQTPVGFVLITVMAGWTVSISLSLSSLYSTAPNLKGRPRKKKVPMCQRRDSLAQSGNTKEPVSVEARTPSKVTLSLNNKQQLCFYICQSFCLLCVTSHSCHPVVPVSSEHHNIFIKPTVESCETATVVFLSLFH